MRHSCGAVTKRNMSTRDSPRAKAASRWPLAMALMAVRKTSLEKAPKTRPSASMPAKKPLTWKALKPIASEASLTSNWTP
ncbi:hypothetical protein D3C76_1518120 [compost metagenome]